MPFIDQIKVGNTTRDIQDTGARTNEGTLANLTTTEKGNLVGAINEVNAGVGNVNTALANKANVDGYYESMTVGNAEQLVATVGVEDSAPYNFRTAGGSADIGDRLVDKIVGGTIAWNQLLKEMNSTNFGSSASTGGTATFSDGVATVTASVQYAGIINTSVNRPFIPDGHKVLCFADVKLTTAVSNAIRLACNNQNMMYALATTSWQTLSGIITWNASENPYVRINDFRTSDFDSFQVKNVMWFDLTQMFGSTIADYISSLETTTAGAGVAWFKKLFPKDYYAYNPSELMSVQAASHNTVGFNAIDETLAYQKSSNNVFIEPIPVVPGQVYELTSDALACTKYVTDFDHDILLATISSQNTAQTFTVPDNCTQIRLNYYLSTGITVATVLAAKPCLHLHWDGERDGEYEEYNEHVYPLDDSLTLRGIPKLDSANNLYYDGDTYESDGTVTRKYFELTLTGDETYNVYSSSYIKSDACDASIAVTTKNVPNYETNQHAVCNQLIGAKNQGLWELEGHAGEFTLNGGTQLHINIANTTLGITDYTQETTTTVATKIKAYVKALYDAGTPLKFTLPIATPTTESADPYQNPQIVDDFGTEEYVDAGVTAATPTRDVAIPVGHETTYQANLRAKLEMAPDSPSDGDGDYIVRQTNGTNEYAKLVIPAELPTNPTEDGTYHLKATVSNGTTTLTWEADT